MNTRVGRYEILEEISRSRMAVVYRARDPNLGRTVALKVLLESGVEDSDSLERFKVEAKSIAALSHPSILRVLDFDKDNGRPYLVCDYLSGQTLQEVLAARRLAEPEIVSIATAVARGLAHAHDNGILHRDIKPSNVMISADGHATILDFGLAKWVRGPVGPEVPPTASGGVFQTLVGTIVGTPQYMSPEQVAGGDLDSRTDLFSLGVVLYELVAGRNPFLGGNFASIVGRIMSPDAPALPDSGIECSAGLRAIIARCLQKDREARYRSAHELLHDLAGLGGPARSGSVPVQPTGVVIPRSVARSGLLALQVLYLVLYLVALGHPHDVLDIISIGAAAVFGQAPAVGFVAATVFLVSGCCGIAVRLYLLACAGFDHPMTGRQFRRLFPFLLILDEVWALSPFLLIPRWSAGYTIICSVVLAYLPISHRNLVREAYPER